MPATQIGPWIRYNDGKLAVHQKKIDFSSDAFKVAICTSATNAADRTLSPARYADITHELSTSGGYTVAGVSVASPTLTGGGATDQINWDTGNAVWAVTGGGFTGRVFVLYDNTATNKDLIAYCVALDSSGVPADFIAPVGFNLTLAIANVFGAL